MIFGYQAKTIKEIKKYLSVLAMGKPSLVYSEAGFFRWLMFQRELNLLYSAKFFKKWT